MPNVTISLDEKLLKAGREYARTHRTTLNALIRDLVAREVTADPETWLKSWFILMDQAGGDRRGRTWTRDELHDR